MEVGQGEGHAVGPTLFDMKYHSMILTDRQGEYSLGLQGDSGIVRHDGRWVNIYSARGAKGACMCMAYSNDLFNWEYEPKNPVLWPPDWAVSPGKFGHAWMWEHQGIYLICPGCEHKSGLSAAGLISTKDFRLFRDHGPMLLIPMQMRGTRSMEATTLVFRDGLWHLFYNIGEGVWHTVSVTPDGFMGLAPGRYESWTGREKFGSKSYMLGRFHAERVFQDPVGGKWYMIYTRKEYQRWLNREAGLLTPRGSEADERPMMDGIFLSEIAWEGDYPVLKKARA